MAARAEEREKVQAPEVSNRVQRAADAQLRTCKRQRREHPDHDARNGAAAQPAAAAAAAALRLNGDGRGGAVRIGARQRRRGWRGRRRIAGRRGRRRRQRPRGQAVNLCACAHRTDLRFEEEVAHAAAGGLPADAGAGAGSGPVDRLPTFAPG